MLGGSRAAVDDTGSGGSASSAACDRIAVLLPATSVTISLSIIGSNSRRAEILALDQDQAIIADALGSHPV